VRRQFYPYGTESNEWFKSEPGPQAKEILERFKRGDEDFQIRDLI